MTAEKDFDVGNKKLCNVADPIENNDAVKLRKLKRDLKVVELLKNDITTLQNDVKTNGKNNGHSIRFKLTDNKDFDIENKKLSNVVDPTEENDAVNFKTFIPLDNDMKIYKIKFENSETFTTKLAEIILLLAADVERCKMRISSLDGQKYERNEMIEKILRNNE